MRTAAVKELVESVLNSIKNKQTKDIINTVFSKIENTPALRRKYDELCEELSKLVVNTWGGIWISRAVNGTAIKQVKSTCSVIGSYSQLKY